MISAPSSPKTEEIRTCFEGTILITIQELFLLVGRSVWITFWILTTPTLRRAKNIHSDALSENFTRL